MRIICAQDLPAEIDRRERRCTASGRNSARRPDLGAEGEDHAADGGEDIQVSDSHVR